MTNVCLIIFTCEDPVCKVRRMLMRHRGIMPLSSLNLLHPNVPRDSKRPSRPVGPIWKPPSDSCAVVRAFGETFGTSNLLAYWDLDDSKTVLAVGHRCIRGFGRIAASSRSLSDHDCESDSARGDFAGHNRLPARRFHLPPRDHSSNFYLARRHKPCSQLAHRHCFF